jgi:hypothetical protein
VFGFAFALRAGVVIGPVVALLLWRGISTRWLITIAGALLALVAGVAAAVVFGFVFALRAGAVIGPVTVLVLWRGISQKQMITIAGALLAVAVPAIYLIFPATDRGGYGPAYPVERLGAHWVTVGAVVLLILALARSLSTASRARSGRAAAAAPTAPAARSQP